MKTILYITAIVVSFTLFANENEKQNNKPVRGGKPPKELLDKYDTDKNGILDKSEREKITPEDKQKFRRGPRKGPSERKVTGIG